MIPSLGVGIGAKIAFFHPYYGEGGVERTNVAVARFLMKHDFEVEFVTFKPKIDLAQLQRQTGIKCVDLGVERAAYSIAALRRYITEVEPDILFCAQNYANIVGLLASVVGKTSTKIVLSERNSVEGELTSGVKKSLIRALVSLTYRYADARVANSVESARQLQRLCKTPVQCIYNPTIDDRIFDLAAEPIDHPWFGNPETKLLLSVGRLTPQKDYRTLLRAMQLVRKQLDARLLILGEGDDRDELQKLALTLGVQNVVQLLGFQENPYKFLAKANVFVLSSVYEGLPNALIEAVALKIPSVSTDCPTGPTEILLGGRGGELVPVGDYEKMAEAIVRVLRDEEAAQTKARVAKDHVFRFTPEAAGTGYLDLVKSLLA